jgi:hypothetical protein
MLTSVGHFARNDFHRPMFFQMDLRMTRRLPVDGHWNIDLVSDEFNMLNRRNVSDVNYLCNPTSRSCATGTPQQPRACARFSSH